MAIRILARHLWEAGLFLQAFLVITLLAKKSWKQFPLFGVYSFFCFMASALLYALRFSPKQYLSVRQWVQGYWIAEIVGLMLGFGVIYEIFRKLFSSYPALRALATAVFQWASCA